MWRSIALLVGATGVFLVAAAPVAAAPSAPETATTAPTSASAVPSDAVGLALAQVAGSGLAITLDPGASEEHDLVVSNHTANLRLTIKLSATDATGQLGTAAASWLAFGDDEIQLEPHAATTVAMTVAVPHDTQPGSALAHVDASVETAVAAADGSPVSGSAHESFPVAIDVRGTPTAQIAVADVHRVDQGSVHQLAVVLRNFGDQGAQVAGHVVVAGDKPQSLPFPADLAPSRDTTVSLDWNAPPAGTASDIAVDVEYGSGNVASWSSRLGGAPTDLSPPAADPTPTTTAVTTDSPGSSDGSATPAKPWWKQTYVMVLAILALLGAGAWFVFEMSASRRRQLWAPAAGSGRAPPGWVPAASDESIDLARQLVRLTEVVVDLVASHRGGQAFADERARARSPGLDSVGTTDEVEADDAPHLRLVAVDPPERDESRDARAGPAPPGPEPAAAIPLPFIEQPEVVRSASETPSVVARLEPEANAAPAAVAEPAAAVEPEVAAEPPRSIAELAAEMLESVSASAPTTGEIAPPAPDPGFAVLVAEPEPEADEPETDEPDVVEAPADAPLAAMMERIVELDGQRRQLRNWMDAEEAADPLGWATEDEISGYRPGRTPGESS